MGFRDYWRAALGRDITEAAPPVERLPNVVRRGYEMGIPPGGINDVNQGIGEATGSDRRTILNQLHDAYLTCPWSWAAVNAIARSITGGGLVFDWDGDDGEGDQDQPDKPADVLACERLLSYVNPREDIRQLLRGVISDLLVFGDAYLEVVWLGSVPVALYSLDCPSMFPVADQHGTVTGYVQLTELGQRAEFEPNEIIHVSLDSPRSGIYGISPTQAALMPITTWLFTSATLKGIFRKGMPPALHVDLPASYSPNEVTRWQQQYATRNLGPSNIGIPVTTKGGGQVKELAASRVVDLLHTLDQKRDEVLASYGVPPAEAGVIESGNLGGGTGDAQHRMFMVNTCAPIANLLLEKLNFHIVRNGFGVSGWHLKFHEIDLRDSQVIETIRSQRLRDGAWTINKYRAEIGEPPIEGGDQAVLVDRQNLVVWRDMNAFSKSLLAKNTRGTSVQMGEPGGPDDPVQLQTTPQPPAVPAAPTVPGDGAPEDEPDDSGDQPGGGGTSGQETVRHRGRPLRESWAVYSARIRQAMAELPQPPEE